MKKTDLPRPEYPRPQFVRAAWQNLNGPWEFRLDPGASGVEREFFLEPAFERTITVPFCPESALSGIGCTDFMSSVWYAREVELTAAQLEGVVLLHFGACDYETTVYVGGVKAGSHRGGYCSFEMDVTRLLRPGKNRIVVHARDEIRDHGRQPCGKQSRNYYSHDCDYTRTTGIWQTVWLEFAPKTYLRRIKVTATDLGGAVRFTTRLNEYVPGAALGISVALDGKIAAERIFPLDGVVTEQYLTVDPVKLWNPGEPNLYDVRYTLYVNDRAVDTVTGYFGIRRIDIDGCKVRINGKTVFQRLILDQGFYPDGIYTAPDDAALVRDIRLAMDLGYNGARLHQKVFEERFLYHADRLGYLVWGEYASWGIDLTVPEALHTLLPEWLECVERDYDHPALIGWCPHNETWDTDGRRQLDSNISALYRATKAADPTRPVIDTSGNYHTDETDIFDIHDYCQDPAKFKEWFSAHAEGKYFVTFPDRQTYTGGPYMVSEYGGIKWRGGIDEDNDRKQSWGYGDAPKTEAEFTDRFCGLAEAILAAGNIMGFCYTQLTDVEQEQNGLVYYDRSPKFPPELYERIRRVNTKKAAIED